MKIRVYNRSLFSRFLEYIFTLIQERMRELQAQAAEKRMRENETRGIKNIDSVKRQQAKKDQLENLETNQSGNLRVFFFKYCFFH